MTTKTKEPEYHATPLVEALSERYLAYALSTITARSLPDVRDGLKPVHRRLLYAMRQLKLDPRSGFKKCARVVGDVIGKYHPHGEVAVYDALVRLAQDFSARYPLVDGQGNFGNVDGDNAAAMRYTEARLTAVAEALLEDIDQDTVDFRPTYDGTEQEPVVLPAAFPNLLANGAAGIAVGMATSIPPHNVAELCAALLHLIKAPNARIESLVEHVPGPDFPTGGMLVEPRQSIIEGYRTGRGSFRLRARWRTEKVGHGQYQIVVSEIPYQVPKARLIERIAELMAAKKLPWLADIRDESAEDLRIVLEPKSRTVDAEALMEALFRGTELETRIGLNLNVLNKDGVPVVMSLADALRAFLDHRREVLLRRGRFRLDQITHRLELLDGYLVAFLNLDAVIKIIRTEDEPRPLLMRRFKLTEVQAEAILNLRLRALRKLEEVAIQDEHKALKQEGSGLRGLLRDQDRQWRVIADEIKSLRAKFGPGSALGRRRTEITEAPSTEPVSLEATVEREPVTVLCSDKGWIRAVKGHLADDAEIKFKEGDGGRFRLTAFTTDRLIVFATNGRCYTLAIDKLPGGRGFGEPIRLMIDLGNDHDLVALRVHRRGQKLLVASSDGRGFVVGEDTLVAQTRTGKQVLNVSGAVEAQVCVAADGDMVAVAGDNHKLLIFALADLPEMARGRGVTLQKFKDGGLADARVFAGGEGLSWAKGERRRTMSLHDLDPWLGKRAQAGRIAPPGFPKNHRFG